MYPYSLHRRSLEIPRRCGCGKGVGEILEEKYKVELEFPEWRAMQNKKIFSGTTHLHIFMSNFLITVLTFGNIHVCNQISIFQCTGN